MNHKKCTIISLNLLNNRFSLKLRASSQLKSEALSEGMEEKKINLFITYLDTLPTM